MHCYEIQEDLSEHIIFHTTMSHHKKYFMCRRVRKLEKNRKEENVSAAENATGMKYKINLVEIHGLLEMYS